MRRVHRMLTLALRSALMLGGVAPGALVAQAPVNAPSTLPEAAVAGLPPEPRLSPAHLSLTFVSHSALVRTSRGAITESNTGFSGLEFTLQPKNGGIGLTGRMLNSPDGLEYLDGGLLIGSRVFSLDLTYATRTAMSPGGGGFDSTQSFARGGFRTHVNLGNTGFTARLRANYYVEIVKPEVPARGIEGWEGETGLGWSWDRFPVTAQMGYRIERFLVHGVEQEVSALVLGAGIVLGRR